jgi:hypothetical protein
VGIGRFTRLASACYMRAYMATATHVWAGAMRESDALIVPTWLHGYSFTSRIHILRRAFSEALIVPSFINDFNIIIIKFYILNFIFRLPRRLDSIKPSTNLFNLILLV